MFGFNFGKSKKNDGNQPANDAKKKKKRDSMVSVESAKTPTTPDTPDTPDTLIDSPTYPTRIKESSGVSLASLEELQNNLAAAIRENTELNKRIEQFDSWYIATFGNGANAEQVATNYRTWCESVSHLQHELVSKETNLSQQIISECHLEGNAPLTLPETIALINQKISVTATSEASKMQTLRDRITSLESQLSNTQTDYQKEKQDRERQQTTLNNLKSTLGITDLNRLPSLPPGETLTSILAARTTLQATLAQKQARITELETSAGNLAALNNQISTQQTTITSQAAQLNNLRLQGEKSRNWNIALGILLVVSWLVMSAFNCWKFYPWGKKPTKKPQKTDEESEPTISNKTP
jgi:hypothetical protein